MLLDNIPPNLFTPLSSANKHIYSDCLYLIYKYTKTKISFGIEREIIVEILERYFEDLSETEYNLDSMESILNSRERASDTLKILSDFGWISVEEFRYQKYINLNDYAIEIIKTLESLSNKSTFVYEGYISTIYKWLSSEQDDNEKALLLDTVYDNTEKLIDGLKSLHSNIRRYMEDLTQNTSVNGIVDVLLYDYRENIVDKAYHRLVTSDNVSKYRPYIIEKLEKISLDSDFIFLAGSQMAERLEVSDLEGVEAVKDKLESIIVAFRKLDEILYEIDVKNSRYQRSAKNRAKFLLNNSADTSGQINTVLKYITNDLIENQIALNDIYDNDFIKGLFTIERQGFIDENSLTFAKYRKPKIKNEDIEEIASVDDNDDSEVRMILENSKKRIERKNRIKKRVESLLENKTLALGSEIDITSKEDYTELIYTFIYGTESESEYEVEDGDVEIKKDIYRYKDFEIRRR